MNKGFFLSIGVFLLCAAALYSGGIKEEGPLVRVTGVVRLVGSGLFPELVISGSEGDWYVAGEEQDKLHDLQQRTVTVEGVEAMVELKFANGVPAGRRRELRNIKVISIQ